MPKGKYPIKARFDLSSMDLCLVMSMRLGGLGHVSARERIERRNANKLPHKPCNDKQKNGALWHLLGPCEPGKSLCFVSHITWTRQPKQMDGNMLCIVVDMLAMSRPGISLLGLTLICLQLD